MSVSSDKHVLESFLIINRPQLTYRVGVELSERCHDVGTRGGRDVRKKSSLSVRVTKIWKEVGFRTF